MRRAIRQGGSSPVAWAPRQTQFYQILGVGKAMNRRRFLCGTLAGSASLALAKVPDVGPNEFVYRGWRVRWRGWIEPVNQNVRVGVWLASGRGGFWYSTTMGVTHRANELDVMDLSRAGDGVVLTGFSSEVECAAAKEAARVRLLRAL